MTIDHRSSMKYKITDEPGVENPASSRASLCYRHSLSLERARVLHRRSMILITEADARG